jgi:hypothetical protein
MKFAQKLKIAISKIRYEIINSTYKSICKFLSEENVLVGSPRCCNCKYHERINRKERWVKCSIARKITELNYEIH